VGVGIGMVMGRRWSKTWEFSRVEPSRAKFGLWMLWAAGVKRPRERRCASRPYSPSSWNKVVNLRKPGHCLPLKEHFLLSLGLEAAC
jgi:hypothetical protein